MLFHSFLAATTSAPLTRIAYRSAVGAASISLVFAPIAAAALSVDALSSRQNVIPAAEADQSGADFRQLLRDWQKCFTREDVTAENAPSIIYACDRASAFSLQPIERERVARRRAKLSEALDHRTERAISESRENAGPRMDGR